MEKYGTPQKKTEDDGVIKVAAVEPKECCKRILMMLLPNQEVTCGCGNKLGKA